MARPVASAVTEAEQAILEVLWARGEASVRDVTEALAHDKTVAYTTVLTMLGVLLKKGLVSHRPEGRAFIYRAAVSRDEVRGRALHNLLAQMFDGSPEALAVHLVENHALDPDKLKALRDRVKAARTEGE